MEIRAQHDFVGQPGGPQPLFRRNSFWFDTGP
ncbi:hypothetical protein SAMN05216219_1944 [Mycetocola miduiensis]|uniref:Uncharacterized protein n=1 Tax=Mycetocola miduiensis TaxID=995034 RepID=A0A1I5BLC3_9MICO|nr:hypothetical protein SAMN05216219_1944 [Mycetocola miduiensis]